MNMTQKAEAVRSIVKQHREGTADEPGVIHEEYESKIDTLEQEKESEIEELERVALNQ